MAEPNLRLATGPTPAVLTPLDDHMGLDIARALSAKGVPVFAIDTDERVCGRRSNALTFVHCPHSEKTAEEEYIDFLIDFGARLGDRAVLYPLSDRHVLLVSEYRDLLAEHYEIVMAPHRTMVELTTKDGLDAVARDYDIPAPKTFFLDAGTDIRDIAEQVPYPAILKPTESTYWHSAEITALLRRGLFQGRAKVVECGAPIELVEAYETIAEYDPRMIVQEVIPGEDARLVYGAFYANRESRLLGYFSGRKHRVIPTGFGSASFVETFDDPELRSLVERIVSATGYQGLGGLEFKQDPRDGVYKLIEFNTRFGMWDGLGVRVGVDLAHIAYRDALGLPVEPAVRFSDGMKWVDWQRDIRAFLDYRRAGELTFSQWVGSLSGPKMIAIYAEQDPLPGVAFTFELLGKLWSRSVRIATGTVSMEEERA